MIFLELSLLFFLVIFIAFLSASESAVTALSAVRIKRLLVLRPDLRVYFSEWLTSPHRLLTSLLILSNPAGVALSSLAATVFVPLAVVVPENVLGVAVWLLTTTVLLVVGEIVPKIFGRVYRERVCEWTMPLLTRLSQLLFLFWGPMGWAMHRWAPRLSKAPVNPLMILSLEELHHIIEESQAAGQVPGESGEMMKRVLSLSQKTVAEIQQPVDKVDMVPLEYMGKNPDRFTDLLVETGHTRVPVSLGGDPVGYVNVMDILSTQRGGEWSSVIRPLSSVTQDQKVSDLLHEFQRSGKHMAAVRSAEGRFLGLVTSEDVLEEIVGEILDEYDLEEKKP